MTRFLRRPRHLALALPALLLLGLYTHALSAVVHQGRSASTHAPEGAPLVMLGKRVGANGPDADFTGRLERTRALLLEWPEAPVVLSGGFPGTQGTEAAQAALLLAGSGSIDPRWLLEERSTNTFENVAFSQKLVEPGTVMAIVSNRYHLARVQAIARRQGVLVSVVAAEDDWSWSMKNVRAVLMEGVWMSGISLGLGPKGLAP